MTIGSATNRLDYTGNGTASEYSYTFKIIEDGDLLLTVRDTDGVETTLTLDTDYTVSGAGDSGGGSITLVDANQAWLDSDGNLEDDYALSIRRVVSLVQETNIRNQGDFYPEVHEDALDRLVMIDQQQQDEIDRSLKFPETDGSSTSALPSATDRASQFLAFDSDGNPIAATTVTSAPVSSFMETLLDDTSARAAAATLELDFIVSVVHYGATGDGTTNDTLAIQAALTAGAGGTVFFPAGTYLIDDELTVPNNTKVQGVGSGSVIKVANSSALAGILIGTDVQNVSIESLKLLGLGTWTSTPFAHPSGGGNAVGFTSINYGIHFTKSSGGFQNIRILNCEITGLEHGIYLPGGDVSSQVLIQGNYVHDMGMSGITVFDSSQISILGNNVENVQGNITSAGVTATSSSKFADCILVCSSQDVLIQGNTCYDFHRAGIIIEPNSSAHSQNVSIIGNVVDYAHDARGTEFAIGIYLGDGFIDAPNLVADNIVSDCEDYGIQAEQTHIQGGSVYDCDVGINPAENVTIDSVDVQENSYGIAASTLSASNVLAIRNCTIKGNETAGINLDECEGVIEISGNLIADNGGATTSRAKIGSCAGISIAQYFNTQKVLIHGNTFVSSANAAATTGQLYAILGYAGGDFNYTTAGIEGNKFQFTGTLAAYPTSLAAVPTSFAYDNTSAVTVYEITTAYGNLNSKLATTGVEGGNLAGFPRFLGFATAAPVSGAHRQGDYYLHSNVSTDQIEQIVCVADGTPGTWQIRAGMTYASGNYGVGVTTPLAKHQVNGNQYVLNGSEGAYSSSNSELAGGALISSHINLGSNGWKNAVVINSVTGSTTATRDTTGLVLSNTYASNSWAGAAIKVDATTGSGQIGFYTGTSAAVATLKFLIDGNATPSSASDTGTAGTIRWDSGFIYICTAANTWKRVVISTW